MARGWLTVVVLALTAPIVGCRRPGPSSTATRSATLTASGIEWRARVEIARGDAVRGPWTQNDSVFRWVDDPSVQIADDGDAIVAWVDQAKKDVFLGRWSRAGAPRMDPPVNVSRSAATFSWVPRVVVFADEVHVLWQEIVFSGGTHGGEIFVASSRDGGRTFAAPINLSNSVPGDGKGRIDAKTWDNGSLDLARGPRGELYAAWTEYEGPLWLRRSDDGGAMFAPAVRVGGTREAPARGPSLATSADGRLHVAWALGEADRAGIQIATSHDRGVTFAPPTVVGGDSGRSDAPSIAIDEGGATHVVYVENGRPMYCRLPDPPRAIAGEGARSARVAVGRDRDVFVVVERKPDLVVARSTNGGDTFVEARVPGASGSALGTNGSQQSALVERIAVAPDGREIAVVNSTFLENRESHVWLVRGASIAPERAQPRR
jgi:hypothetical protein